MNSKNPDWSELEVEVTVNDYFDMLRLELIGEKYNKSEHRRNLIPQLDHRSGSAVEKKHQNISAVLIEMGIPYIDGYKPLSRFQGILRNAVSAYLVKNPEIKDLLERSSAADPEVTTVTNFLKLMEDPPRNTEKHTKILPLIYNPIGVNFLEQEANNQKLGDAGEEFVINFERARLIHAGKESLADRIEHVAVSRGPSAGFDIRSFETNGSDRFIEAKTTKYGKCTPFFVTRNELAFSQVHSPHYYLYRLFKFNTGPKLFALQGDLNYRCELKPELFVAKSV